MLVDMITISVIDYAYKIEKKKKNRSTDYVQLFADFA
jgi:hypothetical protein